MPEMTPVADHIIPPDPMRGIQTLSGIIGIQQQQQALQTGQYLQQQAQAGAQQAQQRSQELQALAQFSAQAVKDPNYRNSDGSLNIEKFQTDATNIAPVYGLEQIGKVTSNVRESVGTRQAIQNLREGQAKTLSAGLLNEANNPHSNPTTFLDTVSKLRAINPTDPDYNRMIDNLLLGADRNNTQETAAKAAAAFGGLSQQQTSSMDLGGKVQPGTTIGFGPGQGTFTPSGPPQGRILAPGYIYDPVTHEPKLVGGLGGGSAPKGNSSTANSADVPDTMHPYPGMQGDVDEYRGEFQAVRAQGLQAARSHGTNEQILALSANATTGPGTSFWRSIPIVGGMFGDDYQKLGKFLEKNAIDNMQAMGGTPSDARLTAAVQANGSTKFNPDALQHVTKFNDATSYALERFQQGAAKATRADSGKPNYLNYGPYKDAWAKNFNMDAFLLENAQRRGDMKDYAEVLNSLKGNPARAKAAKEALRNLDSLATTGRLP